MARTKAIKPIRGRVIAITGGARGIGRATAAALIARGARVAIGDLDAELAARTAAELGGETLALALDVTSGASFQAFLDEVEMALGPLDVLVNNAGIMPVGRFLDEDEAVTRAEIEINVHGVIRGSKLALMRMLPRGRGHLVNIASLAGKGGFPGIATYCGSKHAVVGFSESIRQELRGTSIEVSCVMPALVNTELTTGVGKTRLVRTLGPEEVAEAIAGALERPRFDVWVPRENAVLFRVLTVLPRSWREGIARALGGDTVLLDADQGARAAYEARAARSAPSTSGAASASGADADDPAEVWAR